MHMVRQISKKGSHSFMQPKLRLFNLLKGPAKLKHGVKAKSSISGHEGEPVFSKT